MIDRRGFAVANRFNHSSGHSGGPASAVENEASRETCWLQGEDSRVLNQEGDL